MADSLETQLLAKLKVLHDTVWENRAGGPAIETWLGNFVGSSGDVVRERLHALYLLSQFIYFGSRQMRSLLKAMYRDLYRYPIVEQIRRANRDTLDSTLIENEFHKEVLKTRFLGIGNPSESGSHLLYFFRQENVLPKTQFIHAHQIFDRSGNKVAMRDDTVTRYVFIDDFSGSGSQGKEYSKDLIEELKAAKPDARCEYHVLFATERGMSVLRTETRFDHVACIYELDNSFKCFGGASRYFTGQHSEIDKGFAEAMCGHYGSAIVGSGAALGFGDCQLLLGFHHNTPDNTLPIFWFDEPNGSDWMPIFRRYSKYYGWGTP